MSCQLSRTFKAASCGVLPTISLNKPIWPEMQDLQSMLLAFITPPQDFELHYFMVATAKAAVDCHIHNQFLPVCEQQELSVHHSCLASAAPALRCYSRQPQKSRFIVSCCVTLPPHVRVIEVAHKNHGLGGNTDFYLLAEQQLSLLFLTCLYFKSFVSFFFPLSVIDGECSLPSASSIFHFFYLILSVVHSFASCVTQVDLTSKTSFLSDGLLVNYNEVFKFFCVNFPFFDTLPHHYLYRLVPLCQQVHVVLLGILFYLQTTNLVKQQTLRNTENNWLYWAMSLYNDIIVIAAPERY